MKWLLMAVLSVGIMFGQAAAAEKQELKDQKSKVNKTAKETAKKEPKKEEKVELKSQKDRISYSIGMDIGNNFKKQGFELDGDLLARGIKDSLTGNTNPLLTEKEVQDTIAAFRKDLMEKNMALTKQRSEKNKKEGEEFLAENKKKEGVITLPSGLQYKVLAAGSGDKPKENDTVTVNYRGNLIDGTEFDSSYKRNEPATFPVKGVIAGWTEALQLMQPGSKWQLVVPATLGYGERGAGANIGPNATLVFEVELLTIKAPEKQTEKAPEKK